VRPDGGDVELSSQAPVQRGSHREAPEREHRHIQDRIEAVHLHKLDGRTDKFKPESGCSDSWRGVVDHFMFLKWPK
jgi:hypothetical protein